MVDVCFEVVVGVMGVGLLVVVVGLLAGVVGLVCLGGGGHGVWGGVFWRGLGWVPCPALLCCVFIFGRRGRGGLGFFRGRV